MGPIVFTGEVGTQSFVVDGITVPVWVVPALGRQRRIRVLAQVDTGSTVSSIDMGLATLLRLHPTGSTPVSTFGGTVQAPEYLADLQSDSGDTLTGGQILGARLSPIPLRTMGDLAKVQGMGQQGLLALLGRGALSKLDLSVQGPKGAWTATVGE